METTTPEPLVAVDDDEELIYINNSSSEVIMTTRQIENEWNTLPEDTTMTRPLRNQSSLENYDMSLNPSNVHEFVGRD